jgi:hypothetical protein
LSTLLDELLDTVTVGHLGHVYLLSAASARRRRCC